MAKQCAIDGRKVKMYYFAQVKKLRRSKRSRSLQSVLASLSSMSSLHSSKCSLSRQSSVSMSSLLGFLLLIMYGTNGSNYMCADALEIEEIIISPSSMFGNASHDELLFLPPPTFSPWTAFPDSRSRVFQFSPVIDSGHASHITLCIDAGAEMVAASVDAFFGEDRRFFPSPFFCRSIQTNTVLSAYAF